MSEHSNARSIPFQGTPKRLEEFEGLITPFNTDLYKYDNNTSFIHLPGNHYQHIRFTVGLHKNCYSSLPVNTIMRKMYYISIDELLPYIETGFSIFIKDEVVYNSENYKDFYNYIKDSDAVKDGIFYVLKHIADVLNEINPKAVDVYYEYFDTVYKRNSLIFTLKDTTKDIRFRKLGQSNIEIVNSFELEFKKIVNNKPLEDIVYRPLDILKEYEVDDILDYSFSKPKPDNNKGSIKRNRVYVYHPGYNIISITGEYIKKPIDINIHLNQLPNVNCLREVALLAAKIYAGRVNSTNYETLENEKNLNNKD